MGPTMVSRKGGSSKDGFWDGRILGGSCPGSPLPASQGRGGILPRKPREGTPRNRFRCGISTNHFSFSSNKTSPTYLEDAGF